MQQATPWSVPNETWTSYVHEIYRRIGVELVFLDMGDQGVPNKVRSSKLAWLRKRLDTMELEQVAHTVRLYLTQRRARLGRITAAWLPYVSEYTGPNDEYHDQFWYSLSSENEKRLLSVSYGLLERQGNFSNNKTTRRQDFFYKAVFKHCLDSCLRCLSYTDLCSRTKGLPTAINLEALQPLMPPQISDQEGRESYNIETTTAPPGRFIKLVDGAEPPRS